MATGQNIVYAVTANSNLRRTFQADEAAAVSLEKSILGVNNALHGMAGAVGVGLGLTALVSFGKNIVDTATQLESYRNLIKFASTTTDEAVKNQRNLNDAVKDFKLPIMETYTEYAQLMAMVKGTPVEGQKTRAMFRDLAETLTILHLPAERVQAAIGGIGKLLEEGNLQPRYLRPLIATLPGFGMNLAKEMHVSMEELNVMIAKGQMTHTSSYGYIPKVLQDMRDMYDKNLPEALKSYVAETNELSNAWIDFKDTLAMRVKPEVISFFKDLEKGIAWLKQNEDEIIANTKTLGDLIVLYVNWKVAQMAVSVVTGLYNKVLAVTNYETTSQAKSLGLVTYGTNTYSAATERLTAILDLQNKAILESNLALQRQIALKIELDQLDRLRTHTTVGTLAHNPGLIPGNSVSERLAYLKAQEWQAIQAFGLPINNRGLTASAAVAATDAGGLGAGLAGLSAVAGAAIPVLIVGAALTALEKISSYTSFKGTYANATDTEKLEMDKKGAMENVKSLNSFWNRFVDFGKDKKVINEDASALGLGYTDDQHLSLRRLAQTHPEVLQDQKFVDEVRRLLDVRGNQTLIDLAKAEGYLREEEKGLGLLNSMGLGNMGLQGQYNLSLMLAKYGVRASSATTKDPKSTIAPPKDHVTGQHLVTYNILHGGKVIGQQITTQNVNGTTADTEVKAEEMARMLKAILQDEQIH